MPQDVLIAHRSAAAGCAALHSTAPFAGHTVAEPGPATGIRVARQQFAPWVISRRPSNRLLGFLRRQRVHCTDDRLTPGVDVHVLDRDLLLTLAAIPLQGLECPAAALRNRHVPVAAVVPMEYPGVFS